MTRLGVRIVATMAALAGMMAPAAAQTCAPKLAPPALLSAGKLTMSINPTLPPQQYVDQSGQLQGLNVELGNEIAKRLCLTADYVRMDFPAMVPGLQAARFDAINTGLFWTEDRSKIMYLVPYALQAISVVVMDPNPLGIKTIEDLAGRAVSAELGSYTERKTREFSDQLVAKGLKPITIRTFATATDGFAALRAGQVEAGMNLDETALSLVKRGGVTRILNGLGGSQITFAFRNRQVAQAAADAITEIKAAGTYDQLFDKFEMTRLTEPKFAIRGPGPDGG